MKLSIDSIIIRNFRSFGDINDEPTDHTVSLSDRGAVLICGEVDKTKSKSNGAGKTTLIEAIIWCLFGRLSDKAKPGDKVVNWKSGKDCKVEIITKDGYRITRTRNYEGHSDLSLTLNGDIVEGGDSTNANAQQMLNGIFDLDFNTFICSMFFGQSSGSFLSLGDSKKKEVIENLFGLTKLNYYAKVAKDRINKCEQEYNDLTAEINTKKSLILNIEEEINKYVSLAEEFENNRKLKVDNYEKEIVTLDEGRSDRINIDEVKKKWKIINKSEDKLTEIQDKKDNLFKQYKSIIDKIADLNTEINNNKSELSIVDNKLSTINKHIDEWSNKEGEACPTCLREYDGPFIKQKAKETQESHISEVKKLTESSDELSDNVKSLENKSEVAKKAKDLIESKMNKHEDNIQLITEKMETLTSNVNTLSEAEKHNELCDNVDSEIERYKSLIKEVKGEKNKYLDMSTESKDKIGVLNDELEELESKCEEIGKVASHYTYIYRAHNDKKNLRSYLISGSIPILNNRLSYYFNELNIESDIMFNDSLQIKSSKWPYEYHSGGEKKRVDLALMCALYDTFVSIHGQLTNVLVLDEIDKELDKEGVDEYIRLILDDLSNRIETILVISHKNDIDYAFPSQIKVMKDDGISFLE
jgi:DNA repair exonuclease SbcCD ATPase subunit